MVISFYCLTLLNFHPGSGEHADRADGEERPAAGGPRRVAGPQREAGRRDSGDEGELWRPRGGADQAEVTGTQFNAL